MDNDKDDSEALDEKNIFYLAFFILSVKSELNFIQVLLGHDAEFYWLSLLYIGVLSKWSLALHFPCI